MYHYVRDLTYSRYPDIKGLDVRLFEEQLEFIRKSFTVIRMEDVLAAYETKDFSSLPENSLLLTFDDGYIDHYTVVYPLLKKYGMQGSFFPNAKAVKEHKLLDVNKIHHILATAPIDELVQACFEKLTEYREAGRFSDKEVPSNEELYRELAVPNRFDPGEVIFVKRLLQNRLPEDVRNEIATCLFETYVGISEEVFARELYMNRDQIRCMKEGGMFFGLHGYDHYWLGKLTKEKMEKDILQARDYFSDVIDEKAWVMNYPYGNYSEDVLQFIQKEEIGCKLGLTVEARTADLPGENRYLLPRWDTNDLPPLGNSVGGM
ncbi:MAG: polysaccharide deacetylase family protein [Lachnospiraceae bacterium]|nr:polysaccharide deacetylase family protein [Lachnospiraceae bacterium]